MEIKIEGKQLWHGVGFFILIAFLILIYYKLDAILLEIDNKKPKAVVAHGFDYQKGVLNMIPVTPQGTIVQGPVKLPEVKEVMKPEKKEDKKAKK